MVWRHLKKLNIELSYESGIPLLGIYPDKIITQKYTCTSIFTAALFTIAKPWKQPKCPMTDEWIKKMLYTCINGILLSHENNNKIIPFATTWMELESFTLSGIGQKEKEKYCMISLVS